MVYSYGSLVLINSWSAWENIEEGDVIDYRGGTIEVMHRVSKITDVGLILRPGNGEEESLVTKDMYVGKETFAFPFVGLLLKLVL